MHPGGGIFHFSEGTRSVGKANPSKNQMNRQLTLPETSSNPRGIVRLLARTADLSALVSEQVIVVWMRQGCQLDHGLFATDIHHRVHKAPTTRQVVAEEVCRP